MTEVNDFVVSSKVPFSSVEEGQSIDSKSMTFAVDIEYNLYEIVFIST